MNSKSLENKQLENDFLNLFTGSDICEVSKASTAIMLDRFCRGKEIDFPFSEN